MSESLDSPTYGEAEKPRDPISPLNPRRAERFNPTRFTLHTGGFSFFDSLGTSATAALRRVAHRFAALPAWAQVLSIWAPSRLWGFIVFWVVGMQQVAGQQKIGDGHVPTLLEYLGWWDAEWYERIYKNGYPVQLPIYDNGVVGHNTWAFLPAQPTIAGFIADTTGIPFALSTVMLSVVVSFALAWVIYLLFVGCLNWREHGVFEIRASQESPHRSLALWSVAAYVFLRASGYFWNRVCGVSDHFRDRLIYPTFGI